MSAYHKTATRLIAALQSETINEMANAPGMDVDAITALHLVLNSCINAHGYIKLYTDVVTNLEMEAEHDKD